MIRRENIDRNETKRKREKKDTVKEKEREEIREEEREREKEGRRRGFGISAGPREAMARLGGGAWQKMR